MHDPCGKPEIHTDRAGAGTRFMGYAIAVAVLAAAALVASASPAAAAQPRPAALSSAGFVLADFGVAQSWRVDRHPRFMADITGDGRSDIVGFGDAGVYTAVALGNGGFGPAQFVVGDLGFNQGWRVGTNPRFVTDITGDGRADLVGIGNAGVYTAVALGNGGFAAPQFVLSQLSAGTGGQFFMADLNGDRRADIYNIGSAGVQVSLALGNGGYGVPTFVSRDLFVGFNGSPFDDFQVADVTGDGRAEILAVSTSGAIHNVTARPRTDGTYAPPQRAQNDTTSPPLFNNAIGDITGDGRADLVGFGQTEATSSAAVSHGDGTFSDFAVASDNFGAGAGWGGDTPRMLADLNGDGRADIVGFGFAGVWTATALGNGAFAPTQFVLAGFGTNDGWHSASHPRFVTDITGDGRADIVGFGDAGVYTSVSS
jgi:hypothetical protein